MKIDIYELNNKAQYLSQYIGLKFVDVFRLVPFHSLYSPSGIVTIKEVKFDATFRLIPELVPTLTPQFNGLMCDRGYKNGGLTWLNDEELHEIECGNFLSLDDALSVLDPRIEKEQIAWNKEKGKYHTRQSVQKQLNRFIEFKENLIDRDDIYYIATNKNYLSWM